MLNYGKINLTCTPKSSFLALDNLYMSILHIAHRYCKKMVEVTVFYFEFIAFGNTFSVSGVTHKLQVIKW